MLRLKISAAAIRVVASSSVSNETVFSKCYCIKNGGALGFILFEIKPKSFSYLLPLNFTNLLNSFGRNPCYLICCGDCFISSNECSFKSAIEPFCGSSSLYLGLKLVSLFCSFLDSCLGEKAGIFFS